MKHQCHVALECIRWKQMHEMTMVRNTGLDRGLRGGVNDGLPSAEAAFLGLSVLMEAGRDMNLTHIVRPPYREGWKL